jgi:hypothetical protein
MWYGYDDVKYGVIIEIRAEGQLAFIQWTDGTTGLLDDAWFKVISNDRDDKKT